tara:strand:+ start:12811 stop:13767 length:957 start_codon:yes stop_codon:yes gene_type:complete
MLVINSNEIIKLLDYKSLIKEIKSTFRKADFCPPREIYNIDKNSILEKSQLLLMPAFIKNKYYGVKLLNIFPNNPSKGLDRVKALYVLFDKNNGNIKAIIDGTILTKYRTAAMSALASSYLSYKNSNNLLIIGTGSLVPYMISAHTIVRPIKNVYIWGRNYERAKKVVTNIKNVNINLTAVKEFTKISQNMDIISTVTSSSQPLLYSKNFKKGVHLDLVGAHNKDMIELDSEAFKWGEIYVEDIDSAFSEAGDLIKSLSLGYIKRKNIKNNISELIKENRYMRSNKEQTTIFKSVGHSFSDLAAAILIYKKYISDIKI